MQSRLPRFKRISPVGSLQLTERDHAIIRLVHRHRFLRSSHLTALIGTSTQPVLRRLKLLYHHGYLERPRAQIDYYHRGGSHPMVYGLGNKGGSLMKPELGHAFRKISWGGKNRSVGRIFLEHALLVSEVMVAIELACRKSRLVRFVPRDRLSLPAKTHGNSQPFLWKIKLKGDVKLGVIPDGVFALEFSKQDGESQRAYFFLEADRGTMPVKRRNLSQTSFYRKLLAYEATWSQSIHRTRFGFHRFRVITITTSATRVISLVEACSQLERGRGLFLFADRSVLDKPDEILASTWKTANANKPESLLN